MFCKENNLRTGIYRRRAAMFGLDARIALAIFGTLSVITGATMLKTVREAKVRAEIEQLQQLSKAVQAYMLDVGVDFPQRTGQDITYHERRIEDLLNSTQIGWKGPYIGGEVTAEDHYINLNGIKHWLYLQANEDWGGATNGTGKLCSSSVEKCYYWIKVYTRHLFLLSNEAYALQMDQLIDGGDGDSKGNLRIHWYDGDLEDPIMFYRVEPTFGEF